MLCLQVLPPVIPKTTGMQELHFVFPLKHSSVNHLMDTLWEYLQSFMVQAFPAGLNRISAAAVKVKNHLKLAASLQNVCWIYDVFS